MNTPRTQLKRGWMVAGLMVAAAGCAGSVSPDAADAAGAAEALATPLFTAGFEPGEPSTALPNDFDMQANVTSPQAMVHVGTAHAGSHAFLYSGTDGSITRSYAYARVFDVSIPVTAATRLRYWIYPEDANGAFAGVDLHFTDGTTLRDSSARDAHGCSLHPAAGHCGAAAPGNWTRVLSLIGDTLAGKTIDRIWIAYDQPGHRGAYRGEIDDVAISNLVTTSPPPSTPDAGTPPPPTNPPPSSSTYYVSPSGDDGAAGDATHPWRTVPHAIATAPQGPATIELTAGTYPPFQITRANLTIAGAQTGTVTVKGAAGTRDVILIAASGVTVRDLTVAGCVPNPAPSSFEDQGSSGVRIDDGTQNTLVTGLVIRDSHGTNSEGLPFGCYGVALHNASAATVSKTEIFHNGYGIWVRGGGSGVKLLGNLIHDNDVIIRNSKASNDDYGAAGIGFDGTQANPGPLADGNTVYANSGPSYDYVRDGGGFEIYEASHVTMTNNILHDNEGVLETGTGAGGDCVGNVFSGNTASGKTSSTSPANVSAGLILRCAHDMQVTNNTLGPVQWWVFDIGTQDTFAGSIQGLTITGNAINQVASNGVSEAVYSLDQQPTSAQSVVIDHNRIHTTGWIGYDWHHTPLTNLASWQTTTGFDVHSTLD